MARLRRSVTSPHPRPLATTNRTAGLAILNPAAQQQIRQYASSVTELFKLILEGKRQEFETRIRTAGEFVFGKQRDELLLRDDILDQFSLSGVPKAERKPNSHLSLLGMVDCWWKCNIVPYDHMICSTPVCAPFSFLFFLLRLTVFVREREP
jgi:prephenate dehydrogenase (NADP+)